MQTLTSIILLCGRSAQNRQMDTSVKDHTKALSRISSDSVDLRLRKLFVLFPLQTRYLVPLVASTVVLISRHRLLSLLQYELSGCICLCYSGTPNSIPLSCLILHNERLLAAHRIMSLSDSYEDEWIYFTHFDIFLEVQYTLLKRAEGNSTGPWSYLRILECGLNIAHTCLCWLEMNFITFLGSFHFKANKLLLVTRNEVNHALLLWKDKKPIKMDLTCLSHENVC